MTHKGLTTTYCAAGVDYGTASINSEGGCTWLRGTLDSIRRRDVYYGARTQDFSV